MLVQVTYPHAGVEYVLGLFSSLDESRRVCDVLTSEPALLFFLLLAVVFWQPLFNSLLALCSFFQPAVSSGHRVAPASLPPYALCATALLRLLNGAQLTPVLGRPTPCTHPAPTLPAVTGLMDEEESWTPCLTNALHPQCICPAPICLHAPACSLMRRWMCGRMREPTDRCSAHVLPALHPPCTHPAPTWLPAVKEVVDEGEDVEAVRLHFLLSRRVPFALLLAVP